MSTRSTNVHNSIVRLDDSLVLAGFGGSGPALRDGKLHWKGYPFTTHDEIATPLRLLHERLKAELRDDDSLVLLVHAGPDGFGNREREERRVLLVLNACIDTSTDYRDAKNPIHTGTPAVRSLLEEDFLVYLQQREKFVHWS